MVWSLSHVWLFCDSMYGSPAGSSVPGISQARRGGLLFSSSGDLPDSGIEPRSPARQTEILYQLSHVGSPEHLRSNLSSKVKTLCTYKWLPWTFFIVAVKVNKCYCEGSSLHVKSSLRIKRLGTSLEVQWLRLYPSTAGGVGLIPCQGAKVLCA